MKYRVLILEAEPRAPKKGELYVRDLTSGMFHVEMAGEDGAFVRNIVLYDATTTAPEQAACVADVLARMYELWQSAENRVSLAEARSRELADERRELAEKLEAAQHQSAAIENLEQARAVKRKTDAAELADLKVITEAMDSIKEAIQPKPGQGVVSRVWEIMNELSTERGRRQFTEALIVNVVEQVQPWVNLVNDVKD
jgi:hypothetical protein